jgi:Fe-Mn family superoxide dismutase
VGYGASFGGLAALKAQFSAAAARVEGNGWGVLVWHPGFGRLLTLALMNQQNSALTGAIPLLMCDVWEHAYYLRYQNRRADYIAAWWNVVDWANVSERFRAARSLAI